MVMEIVDLILILIIVAVCMIFIDILKYLVEDYEKMTDKLLKEKYKDIQTEFNLRKKIGELNVENAELKEQFKLFSESNNISDKPKKENIVANVIKEEEK